MDDLDIHWIGIELNLNKDRWKRNLLGLVDVIVSFK